MNRSIASEFSDVAIAARAILDGIVSRKGPKGTISAPGESIRDIKEGQICVIPSVGPVECVARKTEAIAGVTASRFYFRELFPFKHAVTPILAPEDIVRKGTRRLASEDALNRVVHAMTEGAISPASAPRLHHVRKTELLKLANSGDLVTLASVAALAFQSGASAKDRGILDTEMANLSLRRIAAEYAAVAAVPFPVASALMDRAIGKPTLDELSGYSTWEKPAASAP